MQRHRFFAPPDSFDGSTVKLSSEESHHLAQVLRLEAGDEVFVFDGCGLEYRCSVIDNNNKTARVELLAAVTNRVESELRLTLAQSLTKGDKFDFIVQKATELGVACIVPLITDRCEVKLKSERSTRRRERWERVSIEALKQCGRRTLVRISEPLTLNEYIDSAFWRADRLTQSAGKNSTPVVFVAGGGKPAVEALDAAVSKTDVAAFVGPEGGWSEAEMNLFQERQCRLISLGPRTLRTETAAVAALTVLQHNLGDM